MLTERKMSGLAPGLLSAAFAFFFAASLFFPMKLLAQGNDNYWLDDIAQSNAEDEKTADEEEAKDLSAQNPEFPNDIISAYYDEKTGPGEGVHNEGRGSSEEAQRVQSDAGVLHHYADYSPDPQQEAKTYHIQLKDAVMSCKIETQSKQAESIGFIKASYIAPDLQRSEVLSQKNPMMYQTSTGPPAQSPQPGKCQKGKEQGWTEGMGRTKNVVTKTYDELGNLVCTLSQKIAQRRRDWALNDPQRFVQHPEKPPKKINSNQPAHKASQEEQAQPCQSDKGCFFAPK